VVSFFLRSYTEKFTVPAVVAAAMIDRLVHHAEVIVTNGTQNCS
jgi:hypothetical protein